MLLLTSLVASPQQGRKITFEYGKSISRKTLIKVSVVQTD